MNSFLGVTGMQIEEFSLRTWTDRSRLNDFLKKYDGKVIDIQIIKTNQYDDVKAYVIYKES